MKSFDVFNGDADGLCALLQLRLAEPINSTLVTGAKRDIVLLQHVNAGSGDLVTVMDISFDRNRDEVKRLLEADANISYFDHHFAGDIPQHPNLKTTINTATNACTSVLVHRHIAGQFPAWAAVGAFGDNMKKVAQRLLSGLAMKDHEVSQLQQLGECLNYNAYGDNETELLVHPAELYRHLHTHKDPLTFIKESPIFNMLRDHYCTDMEHAINLRPLIRFAKGVIYLLPYNPWSKRVNGVFSNHLAQSSPDMAHAVLTLDKESGYRVNVRAPRDAHFGADELCRQFPSGGGRKAAAGINHLPEHRLGAFFDKFAAAFH